MPTVILYGPPASGKTYNAAEIAQVYGCVGITDEWDNTQAMGFDHLHITRMDYSGAQMAAHDNKTGKLHEVVCVSIYYALKAVGAAESAHWPARFGRAMSKVDNSSEDVEKLIAEIPGTKPAKEIYALQDRIVATLRAQAERIKELEGQIDASKQISYMAGYYQAECGLPEHDTAKEGAETYLAKIRNDALREALAHKWLCFHNCDEEIEVVNVDILKGMIEGASTKRIELKPCPFCGGKGSMSKDYDPDGTGAFHFIQCHKCRAKSPEHYANETCPIFYEQVRNSWNARAWPFTKRDDWCGEFKEREE